MSTADPMLDIVLPIGLPAVVDAYAAEAWENISFIHSGFASLAAEIQIGESVVGGYMSPVQLSVYTGAGLIEVGNGAADDLVSDLRHNPIQSARKSDNHIVDCTGGQGYPKHAAENLFDTVGADCAYGIEGHNKALKLFAVLDRSLYVFRKRAPQGFSGKRSCDRKRFMCGNMDLYGSVRYLSGFGNACLASALLI